MKLTRSFVAAASALILFSTAMASPDGGSSFPTTDASSLKLQVYSVMLSTSPLCTNPYTVFASDTAREVDFLVAPTLGSGNPPDATYQCVIIKMSDIIKFTPTTTLGSCSAGTEYSADICRTDNGGTTQAPNGAPSACTGTDDAPHADPVYMYLTTNPSVGNGGGGLMPPTDANSTNGLPLSTPLVISGRARSKFVVNATGKVGSDGTRCGMNPPAFGFKKLQ